MSPPPEHLPMEGDVSEMTPLEARVAATRALPSLAAYDALLDDVLAARAEMQARADDLRWCGKDDLCNVKAEGAALAINDFDDAFIVPTVETRDYRHLPLREAIDAAFADVRGFLVKLRERAG